MAALLAQHMPMPAASRRRFQSVLVAGVAPGMFANGLATGM
jgi:hypothetical protein